MSLTMAEEFSPATVTQLTERQFPHAGVPEIVNCRSVSSVTFGHRSKLLRNRYAQLRSLDAGECAGDDFWYASMRNLRVPL